MDKDIEEIVKGRVMGLGMATVRMEDEDLIKRQAKRTMRFISHFIDGEIEKLVALRESEVGYIKAAYEIKEIDELING